MSAADLAVPGPDGMWAKKSPDEIRADLAWVLNRLWAQLDGKPDDLALPRDQYIDLVRAIPDPYRRLMLLFNAGCRGRDLR